MKSLENQKIQKNASQFINVLAKFYKNLITWGAQGKMTQLNLIVNSLPRDLADFSFFVFIGFIAGSLGVI